jgi:hypothetical protein
MATLPPPPYRFAGTWNATQSYNYTDLVVASDSNAYVNGLGPNVGTNPTTQPSAVWALAPDSGVTQLLSGPNIALAPSSGVGRVTVSSGAFLDSFQIYVAPNGNNTTGTGSQQNPFATITKAIQVRNASISTSVEVSIILSSGTYTESVTLARNTYLVGVQTGESRQPCNVIGSITMNDTTGSIGISGLEINGTVTTSGAGASYTIFCCNISGAAATAVTATAGTVFITECRISNTSGSTIIGQTTLTIRDCVISTTGVGSCVFVSGNTTLRQNTITSTSASTTALALVRIGNTASVAIEVSLSRLEYTSTATDTGGNKCCIAFTGSGNVTASIVSDLLLCEGAITGSGGQIQCIQDTGAGAVVLAYGNLLAGANAHHISPNTTKTAYTSVP